MAIPLSQLPPDLLYNGQLDVSNGVKQAKYNQLNSQWEQQQQQSQPQQQAVDPVAQAKALNQFYIQQNQPEIATLGSQIAPTSAAYGSSAAAGSQTYQNALNQIVKGVNSSYAQRGLSNNSPQMSIDTANSELPAMSQWNSQLANILQGSQSAINALNSQIGQLQSGAPTTAVTQGLSAAALPSQIALQQAQANAAQYVPIPYLGALNATTGSPITFGANQSVNSGGGLQPIQGAGGVTYYRDPNTGNVYTTPNG